ncbi:hypothetical protein L1887_00223 [Cichorium endivia]|nr:hypothetical protein L1887_00223 [Cichorium endivia]
MSSIASQPLSTPLQMEPVSNQDSSLNVGPQKPLLPSKRKTTAETFSNNPLPLQSPIQNKRVVHVDTHVNSPRGQPNKRMMRNESMSNKTVSPRVQMSKTKTAPPEVSPKVQSESYVRAKMRETLAAALSVGIQNKEELPNEDKNVPEAGIAGPHPPPTPTADVDIKETSEGGQKPQYNYVMPDTEGSFGDTFFVKDELLQGNGLSWAWDMEVEEKSNSVSISQQGQGAESENTEDIKKVIDSPQELAFKIEAELFKLFGGVNKKYKEKGRSLMFNLKDRNNPELREKVLSGKISPERLCSMTPEELASKELSEWRMAKAEELDKMIVLPDSDVDMRRLVKKTHKGEYQVVDFEQDDGISVEVAMGSSSLTQFRPKKKKTEDNISSDGQQVKGEKEPSNRVTVEGTDFMQELIVEEFKDEGFLQPIVSLDEFMESLDTEPPFENLTVDKDKGPTSGDVELASVKSGETFVEKKVLGPSIAIGECLWEGDLQLAISSTVSVIGLFRSGEKTSTKEWPGSIEIKGRVRLEAFEKFLQELPMSRSRAVMVVHFLLKNNSPEFHRASLSESVDSYIAEERVGFGEPSPGTEVYFCPPHKRITEMLSRLLSKDQTEIQKSTDNGLIGVVVWRRPQPTAATLPPHHKHHNRKNLLSRKQETINTNANSKPLHPPPPPPPADGGGEEDDDDDIPPGFGPGVVARDEDDLPEFNFSSGSNTSGQRSGSGSRMIQSNNAPRPVAHMRQLVHEFGQTGNNNINSNNSNNNNNNNNNTPWNGNRPWNRDEDDDIPEWQPQFQIHQRPEVPNHMVNQIRPVVGPNVIPVMHVRPPPNLMQNVWVQPQPPGPHGLLPNAAMPAWQYGGGQWRPEEPRGRGF